MRTDQNEYFEISSDPRRLDVALVHEYLSGETYWARGIPLEVMRRAIANSLCFGVYGESGQVGFARVISDYATFANLVDVFVLPAWRGRGLATCLLEAVVGHESLQGLRRFTLATSDAHDLYTRFGFRAPAKPETLMEIFRSDVYQA